MENKPQILLIHGGTTFSSREKYLDFLKNKEVSIDKYKSWAKDYLDKKLGEKFQIIRPRMPLKENAKYEDWKIWFERYLELLNENFILIGSSLGGTFLAKYLSENELPKKAISVYLIAPPFDNSLEGEELVGGFELKEDLAKIYDNCKSITLFFSEGDDCVPFEHMKKYKNKLEKAKMVIYGDMNGHFRIEEFPALVESIEKDYLGLK